MNGGHQLVCFQNVFDLFDWQSNNWHGFYSDSGCRQVEPNAIPGSLCTDSLLMRILPLCVLGHSLICVHLMKLPPGWALDWKKICSAFQLSENWTDFIFWRLLWGIDSKMVGNILYICGMVGNILYICGRSGLHSGFHFCHRAPFDDLTESVSFENLRWDNITERYVGTIFFWEFVVVGHHKYSGSFLANQ